MFNERAFIARVESADVNELAQIVLRPTRDEERALRVHLGDNRYERLHNLALKRSFVRGVRGAKGNVVVIHGIMGAELSTFDRKGAGDQIWAKVPRLISGWVDRLRLSEDGKTVVGIARRFFSPSSKGFVWTEGTGMVEATKYFKDRGYTFGKKFSIESIPAISKDGKVMAVLGTEVATGATRSIAVRSVPASR